MTDTKVKYTPSEAIRAIKGVTRKRFYEMLNNGDITYSNERWGKKTRRVIDGSEIARVFGSDFQISETTETSLENTSKQDETTVKNRLLEQEVKFLNDKIESLSGQIDEGKAREKDLSTKLDRSFDEKVLLLEDHRKREGELKEKLETTRTNQQPVTNGGFWNWFIGKNG